MPVSFRYLVIFGASFAAGKVNEVRAAVLLLCLVTCSAEGFPQDCDPFEWDGEHSRCMLGVDILVGRGGLIERGLRQLIFGECGFPLTFLVR